MGMLVDGCWTDAPFVSMKHGGAFVRAESPFRDVVVDSPNSRFPVDASRYCLVVAMACPWAHRTLLTRALYGLEDVFPVVRVAPLMLWDGWVFDADHPDTVYGHSFLRDWYLRAAPRCTSRVTVPILWDTQSGTIVNNESSEILRLMAGPFARLGRSDAPMRGVDLRPPALCDALDHWNERIYTTVNNGVYRCGFAATQAAYSEAAVRLFETLDVLEERLQKNRWLVGNRFTEADLRLFPTLIRFDAVYHGHFKCNLRMLRDYAALSAWMADILAIPGVRGTIDLASTRRHYYASHLALNPHGIVPIGPSWREPERVDRSGLGPAAGPGHTDG